MGDWQVYPSRSRGSQMVVDQPYLVSGPPLQQPVQVVTDPYGQQYQVLPTAYQQPSYEMVPSRPFPDQMPLQAQPWQLATAGSRQDLMPTDVDRMRTSAGDVSGYPTEKTAYDDGSYDRATGFPRWTVYAIAIVLFAVSLTVIVVLAMVCTSRTETLGRTTEKPDSFITIRPATKIPAGPADDGRTTPATAGTEKTEHLPVTRTEYLPVATTEYLPVATTKGHSVPERKVCHTEVCMDKARRVLDFMDESVDPCDDFFKFTCQRGIRNSPATKEMSYWDVAAEGSNVTLFVLRDLLRTQRWQTVKSAAMKKMLISYAACENADTQEAENVQAFRTIMTLGGVAPWPLWPPSDNAPSWRELITRLTPEVIRTGIINFELGDRLHALGLGYDANIAYGHKFISGGGSTRVDAYKTYIKDAVMMMNSSFTESDAMKVADEIYDVEGLLANFTRTPDGGTRHMTYAELQVELPQEDWVAFSNQILSIVNICVSTGDIVGVEYWDYLKHVIPTLGTVERTTVLNYLGWGLVRSAGALGIRALSEFKAAYQKSVFGSTDQRRPLGCLNTESELIPEPVARVYLDGVFSPPAKEEAIRIAREEKEAFRAVIKSSEWMDYETKSEALRKADRLELNIGYPEEILNDTLMEKQYEFVGDFTEDTPFLSTWHELAKNNRRKKLQAVRNPPDNVWTTMPQFQAAFYATEENYLQIHAGMLTRPYFGSGLPKACNYGGIGMVIGHEITHGFDTSGAMYDADGRRRDWLTAESQKSFSRKMKCFIEQYGNITNEIAGMKINGTFTQGENAADNGGIRVAYNVYKDYAETNGDTALPGLEKYTNEQLFFISFAHIWCSDMTPEHAKIRIERDPHSLPQQRVNVPLRNLKAFSEAFSCPQGSRMNPGNRCKLW